MPVAIPVAIPAVGDVPPVAAARLAHRHPSRLSAPISRRQGLSSSHLEAEGLSMSSRTLSYPVLEPDCRCWPCCTRSSCSPCPRPCCPPCPGSCLCAQCLCLSSANVSCKRCAMGKETRAPYRVGCCSRSRCIQDARSVSTQLFTERRPGAGGEQDTRVGSGETHSLLACLLRNGTAPPTVTPSRDAPARAINTSTEYSLRRRLDGM